MTTFVQFHHLVDYPAANLNRDDSGRPKTLIYGGAERLRVSSQSLKRALRTGPVFHEHLAGALGTRSQSFGSLLVDILTSTHNLAKDKATEMARSVIDHEKLGKLKKAKDDEETSDTEQLAHLGPDEIERLQSLAGKLAAGEKPTEKEMVVLLEKPRAVDIAMFGRMLADNPGYNVEAAVQVAHAFTTHRAEVEDDYFTAVDEIKAARKDADKGAGFVGVQQYGSGLFYQYSCVNANLLIDNLSGDRELAARASETLCLALAQTSPKGKQNSYASRSIARYALVEIGSQTPRSLASAFLQPVRGDDLFTRSVKNLQDLRDSFARAYGNGNRSQHEMRVDVNGATGSLDEITKAVGEAVRYAE